MTNFVAEPQGSPQVSEADLTFEFSDEALEAAADVTPAAYSFVGSPTISVLVSCCSG